MRINQEGINLIKSFEGCKLQAYKDIVGIWTIGYGHTGPEVIQGLSWTQEQADNALVKDLTKFENGVNALAPNLNANEFSALVVFSYNVGLGALGKSTLLKKLLAGDKVGAADEFLRWNKAGGKEVAGLTRRRIAERALFLIPVNNNTSMLPEEPSEEEIGVKLKESEE